MIGKHFICGFDIEYDVFQLLVDLDLKGTRKFSNHAGMIDIIWYTLS